MVAAVALFTLMIIALLMLIPYVRARYRYIHLRKKIRGNSSPVSRLALLTKVWNANDKVAHLTLAMMCAFLLIVPLELIVVHSRLALIILAILAAGWGIAYLLVRLDQQIFDERIRDAHAEVEQRSSLPS